MDWLKLIRILGYGTAAFLGVGAAIAASSGLGVYDPDLGTFDPHPIHLDQLRDIIVALVSGVAANVLAIGAAVWQGVKKK